MKKLLIGIVVCLVCALAVSLLFNLGIIETSSNFHHIVESKIVLDPKYKVDIRAEYNDTEKALVDSYNNFAIVCYQIIKKYETGEVVTEDDRSKYSEAGYYLIKLLKAEECNEYLVRESLAEELTVKFEAVNEGMISEADRVRATISE